MDHAPGVERHRLRAHDLGRARVVLYSGVDATGTGGQADTWIRQMVSAGERKGGVMQSVIQVTCYRGGSLREALANDEHLVEYHLAVSRQKTSGRNPGWAKVHSTEPDVHGAINLEWDPATKTLMARVVTKGRSTPDRITGDFIAYLIRRQRTRIRSILLLPG